MRIISAKFLLSAQGIDDSPEFGISEVALP